MIYVTQYIYLDPSMCLKLKRKMLLLPASLRMFSSSVPLDSQMYFGVLCLVLVPAVLLI